MTFEEQERDDPPDKIKRGDVLLGVFGDWMYGARIREKLSQVTLAERSGVSRSWISQIESAQALPNEQQRDRLILVLAQGAPAEPLAAWATERKVLEKAEKAGKVHLSRFQSLEKQRQVGAAQRARVLQLLVESLYQETAPSSVTTIAERLPAHKATVSNHVRKLAGEGYLTIHRRSFGVATVRITIQGYQRAVQVGAEQGTWAPPFDQTLEVLAYGYRKYFEHLGLLARAPEPPPPARRNAPPRRVSGPEPVFLGHGETIDGRRVPPPLPVPPPVAPPAAKAVAPTLPKHRVMHWLAAQEAPQSKATIAEALGLSLAAAHAAVESLLDDDLIWWAPHNTVAITEDHGRAWLATHAP